jgi:hypothetical protein
VRDNSCPVVVATLGQVNPTQSGPICSIFFHPWWSQKQWGKWQKLWKIDQIQQIETYRKHCETFCYNYSDIPAHIIIGFKTCIFPQNRDTVGTWICNLEWTSQYVHRVCNKQATTKALLPKRCVLAQCVTFLLDVTLLMYPIPISYNPEGPETATRVGWMRASNFFRNFRPLSQNQPQKARKQKLQKLEPPRVKRP